MTLREVFFMTVARLSPLLPPFRGRTRVFLELYRLLRLKGRHLVTTARLTRPVRYLAKLDLHSWSQRIAFLTGGYEPDTTLFLDELRRIGTGSSYLLDIGANIGLISIPFAKLSNGSLPRVIAFEAVPDNYRAFCRNVELNGLQQTIDVRGVALGDVPGLASIQVEGDLRAGEGTGTANILPEGTGGVRQGISVETLDSIELPKGCGVVKIDTDGYDLKVLMGATRFLARERPVIFGEFSEYCMHWHGQSVTDVAAFAAEHGYLAWPRASKAWRFTRTITPSSYVTDILLVPREREADFVRYL